MSSRLRVLVASVFLVGGLLGASASAALAAGGLCNSGGAGNTCYVSPSGNDAFDGNTPATAKQHFGGATGAIASAGAGGKVIAAAGNYNTEAAEITPLAGQTLQGPYVGQCRQDNPVATEAVLTFNNAPDGTVFINVAGVTLDGFEIASTGTTPAGVATSAIASGYRIQNNLVTQNPGHGIQGNSNAASWIYCNEIRNNGGRGTDTGLGSVNLTIDDNEIQGAGLSAISITPAGTAQNTVISNNDVHDNDGSSDVFLSNANNTTVVGNTITHAVAAPNSNVRFAGNDNGADVNHNILTGGDNGVLVNGAGDTGILVHRNSLTGHTALGKFGVNNAGGQVLPLDGTCNWWGSATGPGPVGPGSGDKVSTNVTFDPWLLSNDLDGPCGADLVVTKNPVGAFTPGVAGGGANGSEWDITVTNQGGGTTTANVTVTDAFPAGFTPTATVCDPTTPAPANAAISCPTAGPYVYPPLKPGQSATIHVTGTTTQAGPSSQTNCAKVAGGVETDTTNNTGCATAAVAGLPRLDIHKTHNPTNFRSPGFGAFFIDVFNSAAAGSPTFGLIRVTDTMTSGTPILSIIAPGWACVNGITSFQCTTAQVLASGQHATAITVIVGIGANPPQAVQNSATVSGGEGIAPPGFGNATPVFQTTTDRVSITRWFHFF